MKKLNKNFFISIILLISLFSSLYPQGIFLPKESSGFTMSANYLWNNNALKIEKFGIYSFKKVDFGIGFGIFSRNINNINITDIELNSAVIDTELNSANMVTSIEFYLLKGNEINPISISLGASYGIMNIFGGYLDVLYLQAEENFFGFSGNLYGRIINIYPSLSLIPGLGVSYTVAELKMKDKLGNIVIDDDDEAFSLNLGLSFAIKMQNKNIFRVTPGILISEKKTIFILSAGIIIPTKNEVTDLTEPQKRQLKKFMEEREN